MLALIDGDIVAYRCAASAEHDSDKIAIARADRLIQIILKNNVADNYLVYLSGDNNFRKDLYVPYKANRTQPKPIHLDTVRAFLAKEHEAIVTNGYEADDSLGIQQTANNEENGMFSETPDDEGEDTVICSWDKDLLQVPGYHYNIVSAAQSLVLPPQAIFNFWLQMIMGDRADNIPGYDGTARAKIPKFLAPDVDRLSQCKSEQAMHDMVYAMYTDKEQFTINAKLLYIWRKEDDEWKPPSKEDYSDEQDEANSQVC